MNVQTPFSQLRITTRTFLCSQIVQLFLLEVILKYPKDPIPASYMDKILDILEDFSLNTYLIRCQNYQTIECMLKNNLNVNIALLRRVLAVCIHDLNEGTKYTVTILNITSLIFKQNVKDWSTLPELVPLASGFINVLKKSTLTSSNMKHLQSLCLNKLSLYPDDVLKHIPSSDMIDLVNYALQTSTGDKSLAYTLVCKYIKALPPDNRKTFIQGHLALWFSKLLPQYMALITSKEYSDNPMLNLLEIVTDNLVEIDYFDDEAWNKLFEFICTQNKYPAVLKQVIEYDNDCWCRVWIILVKLLKQKITCSKCQGVSPINAMLPSVETAFKMDTIKRCQAFQCWKVLIDSFSKETNDSQIIKGIKLFLIPLKSNNAKVVETAEAKFDTWWYLISKHRNKVKDLPDMLIAFLLFCFGGKHFNQQVLVPGFLSDQLKKLCVQAFVEITGHVDCKGCVSNTFTRLDNKLLTGQLLNQYLSLWMNALKQTIIISVNLNDVEVQTQMKCAWNSIVAQAQQLLPDHQERVYNAIIDMVQETIKVQEHVSKFVYDFFLTSLLSDSGIKSNLPISNKDMNYVKRLVTLALDPALNNYCKQCDAEKVVNNLMCLTQIIVCDYFIINKDILNWVLGKMSGNDCSLIMWTALMKSITNGKIDIGVRLLKTMMLWPISHMGSLNNYRYPASVWSSIYNKLRPQFASLPFNKAILNILASGENQKNQQNFFYLFPFIQILQHSLDNGNEDSYKIEINLLVKLCENLDRSNIVEALFPLIIGVMTSSISNNTLLDQPELLLKLMSSVNKLLCKAITSNIITDDQFSQYYVNVLNSIMRLLNSSDITVPSFITQSVIQCAELLTDSSSRIETTYQLLRNLLNKIKKTDKDYRDLNTIIEKRSRSESDKYSFPAPNIASKKAKKKETSIVNTVVENGEEFVVVKSNWKFNPKKLTENQKEKFSRKREDIPALYQDLSQSQEGFKLTTWRADSQESTTSSTKSTSKEGSVDFTNILKNMPNTEVVPKIMENILLDSPKRNIKIKNIDSPPKNLHSSIEQKKNVATPHDPKSPRIALKDRISLNVKALLKKCSDFNDKSTIGSNTVLSDENSKNSKKEISVSPVTSAIPSEAEIIANELEDNVIDSEIIEENPTGDFEDNRDSFSSLKEKITYITTPTSTKKKRGRKPKINVSIPTPIKNVSDSSMTATSSDTPANKTPRIRRKPLKFDPDSQDYVKRRRKSIKDETVREKDNSQLIPNENKTNDENELYKLTQIKQEKQCKEIDVNTRIEDNPNENKTNDENELYKLTQIKQEKQCKETDVNTRIEDKSKTKMKPLSRLEKSLAIDMVEGHPFLKLSKGKRKSRKSGSENIIRRNKTSGDLSGNEVPNKIKSPVTVSTLRSKSKSPVTVSTLRSKSKSPVTVTTLRSKSKSPVTVSTLRSKSKSPVTVTNLPNKSKSPVTISTFQSKCGSAVTIKTLSSKNMGPVTVSTLPCNSKSPVTVSTIPCKSKSEVSVSTIPCKSKSDVTVSTYPSKSTIPVAVSTLQCKGKSTFTFSTLSCNSKSPVTVSTIPSKNTFSVTVSTLPSKSISSISVSSDDIQMSEDFIESSQDSSVTSISLPSKTVVKKSPNVIVEVLPFAQPLTKIKSHENLYFTDKALDAISSDQSKDDIELPVNKSVPIYSQDLTAEMDTESLLEQTSLDDVITIDDDDNHTIVENTSKNITNDSLKNTANADTEPVDDNRCNSVVVDTQPGVDYTPLIKQESQNTANADTEPMDVTQEVISISKLNETQEINDMSTKTVDDGNGLSSPFKDGDQRNADFLNNTLELSPIKMMSPVENERSPQQNKESYVVVKLTSPVQLNGEPFEKSSSMEVSPEVFTDDRMPLNKKDQSPPRATTPNTSPRSLSLKNRPQVRAGGRAAHMLGLCVPSQLIIPKSTEQNEVRPKTINSNANIMSAKRNLRMMYACTNNEVGDKNTSSDEDVDEDYLILKRNLPSADTSPSGPILKRKLVEIIDDMTISPASKRKRVSFHDPPVSTTVSVQKYLEPNLRSPSSPGIKRMIIKARMKSPKKLENIFKLDTALSKTAECFNSPEDIYDLTQDIESSSLETQSLEVIKTTDLNDSDPICPELMCCTDPISEIATELSSAAMKDLLVKELQGKVETVGDLAKMTELEVNRLRIKAPKIKVAKKVLSDYLSKKKVVPDISDATTLQCIDLTNIVEKASEDLKVEITEQDKVQANLIEHNYCFVQTDNITVHSIGVEVKPSVESKSIEAKPSIKSFGVQAKPSIKSFGVQAKPSIMSFGVQARADVSNCMVQTIESGSKTTEDIVHTLIEKPDHVDVLSRNLGEKDKGEFMEQQSLYHLTQAIAKKMANTQNLNSSLESLITLQKSVMECQVGSNECDPSLVDQYMRTHILLCSKLLRKTDKSTT